MKEQNLNKSKQKRVPDIYVLYVEDKAIATGTMKEIAEETGLRYDTIRYYNTKKYKERTVTKNFKKKYLIKVTDSRKDTMANCYKIVDIKNKKSYYLGTKNAARCVLLPFLKEHSETEFCLYGDESLPWGDDKYETYFNNENFGTPYGAEYYDCGEIAYTKEKEIEITEEQFDKIIELFEGKEVKKLYYEILKCLFKNHI